MPTEKGSANCQQQSFQVLKSAESGAWSYRKLSTEAGHAAAASQRGDHQVVHQVQVPVRVHLDEEKLLKDCNPRSPAKNHQKAARSGLSQGVSALKKALHLSLSVILYSDY